MKPETKKTIKVDYARILDTNELVEFRGYSFANYDGPFVSWHFRNGDIIRVLATRIAEITTSEETE